MNGEADLVGDAPRLADPRPGARARTASKVAEALTLTVAAPLPWSVQLTLTRTAGLRLVGTLRLAATPHEFIFREEIAEREVASPNLRRPSSPDPAPRENTASTPLDGQLSTTTWSFAWAPSEQTTPESVT